MAHDSVDSPLVSFLTGLPRGAARPPRPAPTSLEATALRVWIAPLALMLLTPLAVLLFWIACVFYHGEITSLFAAWPAEWWAHLPRPTWTAVAIILGWVAVQGLLLAVLPGRRFEGPVTPGGVRPVYRLNGIFAWVVTHGGLFGVLWPLDVLDPGALYAHFGSVLITLTLGALAFCTFLYWKGRNYPSSPDAVYTRQPLFDFFQGIELHPRLAGVNLKQLINCRVSMMGWTVAACCFAVTQYQQMGHVSTSMAASVAVLVIYLFKFFWWEGGYFHSLDIMHDRFGYYICWGVLVWVPSVYVLPQFWLVSHPIEWHPVVAAAIVAFGALAIYINYQADAQRRRVRDTHGETTVWGRKPELIHARYVTADGIEHETVLLVSGWWGVARHFHYVPELALAAAWTMPAGFGHFIPWFYCLFLAILLTDRALRDEKRCARKYGAYWKQYTARVRWRMLPGIF
ncbi:MAG: hypothetical protein KC620_17710 [Myxococcales bacterium]|nr:hypothetical protein [Myxococcales bacterium]